MVGVLDLAMFERGHTSRCVAFFFFSSRRRHTRLQGDWSSDVCSSDLLVAQALGHHVQCGAHLGQLAVYPGLATLLFAAAIPGGFEAGQGSGVQHAIGQRSEEHTSELQSPCNLVCRLLLEKKKLRTIIASAIPEVAHHLVLLRLEPTERLLLRVRRYRLLGDVCELCVARTHLAACVVQSSV